MGHRIDGTNKEVDKFGAGKHGFTEGTPGSVAPTAVSEDWLDGVQEEICNVIESNGVTLSKGTRDQLNTVLRSPVGVAGGGTAINATGGATDGTALKGTGGSGNGVGTEGIGTGTGSGVKGTAGASSGTGVEGNGINGNGINGTVTGYGIGVRADASAGTGYALVALGDTTTPVRSAFRMSPQDAQPTGPNLVGDLYITTAGILKSCIVSGTPGTWQSVGAQT